MTPRTLLCSLFLAPLPLAQQAEPALSTIETNRSHYERVERELRAATRSCDPAVRPARLRILDLLHEYRVAENFGNNRRFPGVRQPHFVDDDGRRCAVAFLLDRTGHAALTDRVATGANHAWVADLADDEAFGRWLQRHGLTLLEAARIQYPPTGVSTEREQPLREPPEPPVHDGPGDVIRSPAATSSSGGGTSAPSTRPTTTAPTGVTAQRRGGQPVVTLGSTTWLPWFEQQASRWLGPKHLQLHLGQTSYRADVDHAIARCREATGDSNALVRAAAAVSLGQLGLADAQLRDLLDDPAYEVRVAAVVGLGYSGRASAAHTLLHRLGHDDPLQPFAMAALGTFERREPSVERAVEGLLAKQANPRRLAGAAAYRRLSHAVPDRLSVQRMRAGKDSILVRSHLAAAVADADTPEAIAALTQAASSPGLDVRRAAAAALGRSSADLALPSLLTAFEGEHNQPTRVQLLLAIGEHDAPAARAFLVEQVRSGRKPLRGWAAAALGLWGRRNHDPKLGDTLRAGLRNEHNRDHRPLWLLAMGLLQDPADKELLLDACHNGGDSLTRAAAVYALGLFGDPTVSTAISTSLADDKCAFVRAIAAGVLATFGDPVTDALCRASTEDSNGAVRQAAAMALGATGDRSATTMLLEHAGSEDTAMRAAAIRGLGRLFRQSARLPFAQLTWGSLPEGQPALFSYLSALDR